MQRVIVAILSNAFLAHLRVNYRKVLRVIF